MDNRNTNKARAAPRHQRSRATRPQSKPSTSPKPARQVVIGAERPSRKPNKYLYVHPTRQPKSRRLFYDPFWSTRKKIIYWVVIILFLGLAFSSIYYAYRIASGTSDVFTGSYLDAYRKAPLERDGFGRSNILILSTTEDDEEDSGDGLLTDSLMVVSIDQDTKQGNLISIPRDLWVKYPDSCDRLAGKINAVYSCSLDRGLDESAAASTLTSTIGEVIGTDIPYFVRVNQTVLKEVVDSLGGITVTIESSDDRGVYDVETGINLPNGPAKLDGDQALALARARNSKGGYGMSRSNFDRDLNQQMVIRAIQKQALSTGTLTNPNRVVGLAESLGNNLHTNFESDKIRTLIDIARGSDQDGMVTINLADRQRPLTTTGQEAGQSIVLPQAGLFDYSKIQDKIHSHLSSPSAKPPEVDSDA